MSLNQGDERTDLPDGDVMILIFDRLIDGPSNMVRYVKVVNDD